MDKREKGRDTDPGNDRGEEEGDPQISAMQRSADRDIERSRRAVQHAAHTER